ncbi:MAG: 2,3-bisphosphoglycerate-independent phosphoglycerate mutase [candidate division WOR-3 bacterium]|nr:2,3-bisphosphoglycerate-independent phosphoglycerate mutase [candidate division WOR-3 bacterium]MCX7948261.1 2,3-bisphosphoglycerate-independent phosphoglycerate mutase [candidate division WOR-3 bacterium]MDW8151238.1 2,3-bisphosphoglycerate-independent phosphoglycerate mutase [candidate division WOR-3 bacterium]
MIEKLIVKNNKKIVMLVVDGLGGVPYIEGKTELEYAKKENIDNLAKKSMLGLIEPVFAGITPGSGPAHLSLFGYNPIEYEIKRGILEALGIGMELKDEDIAIRGNFATIKDNKIIDRRAGRISTEESYKLVDLLSENIKKIDDVEIFWGKGIEHRFVIVLRGEGLGDNLNDTDPKVENLEPLELIPKDELSKKTAYILNKIIKTSSEILSSQEKANYILLRGISKMPDIPKFYKRYHMKALALANYPMYKGLCKMLGMDTPELGMEFENLIKYYLEQYENYDFIYIHYKETDKKGEDGDFFGKVREIEKIDSFIPKILSKDPDVFILTGDHSTPSALKSHSWHPVPILIYAKSGIFNDENAKFDERSCLRGYLGIRKSYEVFYIILSLAERLEKYGA